MTALKPSEILSRAADLITPEGAWIQGAYALDAQGKGVPPRDPAARCWCLSGALSHETPLDPSWDKARRASRAMISHVIGRGGMGILSCWNDEGGRTQSEVVAALRKASTLALEAGE